MTRARLPRPHEVVAAKRDPRFLRAIRERQDDGAWRTRGVCQSVDPETFFPAPSEPADPALALCRTCEVQGACLAWALDVGDCHGVWGATTPRERRAMLVAWRAEGIDGPHADSEVSAPVPAAARVAVTTVAVCPPGPEATTAARRLGLVPEQRAPRPATPAEPATAGGPRRPLAEKPPAGCDRGCDDFVERVAS
jgi:WhiB family redox-sensing transcriptional regulator